MIRTFNKPEDAYLAASVLENGGIKTNLKDVEMVSNYWLVAEAVGGIKLEVPEDDAEKACELLQIPGQPDLETLLPCPFCHSNRTRMREINLLNGILIFFGFLLPLQTRKVDCMDCGKTFERSIKRE